jgi:hypothetical protein
VHAYPLGPPNLQHRAQLLAACAPHPQSSSDRQRPFARCFAATAVAAAVRNAVIEMESITRERRAVGGVEEHDRALDRRQAAGPLPGKFALTLAAK